MFEVLQELTQVRSLELSAGKRAWDTARNLSDAYKAKTPQALWKCVSAELKF